VPVRAYTITPAIPDT